MNGILRRVREMNLDGNSAALCWLGQMGLLIRLGETVLCVDYFATETPGRQVPPPVPAAEMAGIDAFLGTHDHLDHLDHDAWRIWAGTCPEAKFIFPALHQEKVRADGIPAERCLGLTEGESCRVGDVTVRALAAAHEFLDRDPATGRFPCLQ